MKQEFHVAYIFIKMANSPRPGVWILERSKDHGKTYTPWQFFADNYDDCSSIFGISTRTIVRDDSVICETKYSKVLPLENGEIALSLLLGRPNAENFTVSQVLQEFTKATNIRLRLLRPKTTLGHLISIARQDPTVTRRYFYSIKDINIGGRCVCNGHANSCDITDASQPQIQHCKCQHNTCGSQCDECCPGFVQKRWKAATVDDPNICQPCNCFGHSKTCVYNQTIDELKLSLDSELNLDGGGNCTNCQDNTEGINCNKCKDRFYRPANRPLEAKNVCEPCKCNENFHNGSCAEGSGNCFCKPNFQEPDCRECSYGYTGFPECKPCDCHLDGTIGSVCELKTGECPCKPEYTGQFCKNCSKRHYGPKCSPCDCRGSGVVGNNNECDLATGQCGCKGEFSGRQCDKCTIGFYNYPYCEYCQCDGAGTTKDVCDPQSGACLCKQGFGGPRCDECLPGFFGFPNCTECACDLTGSTSPVCSSTGKCRCSPSFGGMKCDDCSVGHYKHPECIACKCDLSGSHGTSCDTEGKCICKSNFDGPKCDKCKEGFYNYPACEACNCDPAGIAVSFKGCASVSAGELCKCKERVTGRICNQCKDLFWNLQNRNHKDGCEECKCNRAGTINSVGHCNGKTGQCICRDNVEHLPCDTCKAGSFALQEGNLFGCTECDCDIGGSLSAICDKFDGKCTCKPKMDGRRCDRPIRTHFYNTLYQHQYEIEDGRTISDSPARFGYDESVFPDFSWRGYANFSSIMLEVLFPIQVSKPAFYRPIFRYVNPAPDAASALLTLTPDNRDQNDVQTAHIFLEPTTEPKREFGTTKLGHPNQLLLSPGKWTASLRVDRDILVDYLVLIPESYYEARLLREVDPPPCRDEQEPKSLCRHFSYPEYPQETTVFPAAARADRVADGKKVDDLELVKRLKSDTGSRAAIDSKNDRLEISIPMPDRDPRMPPNKHVIVVNYHTPSDNSLPINEPSKMGVDVSNDNGVTRNSPSRTQISFADCPYSFVCRQVVTGRDGDVALFDLGSKAAISFQTNDISVNRTIIIESVNLIPYKNWTLDYIKSKFVCVVKNSDCIESKFSPAMDRKVEFERDQNPERTISVKHSPTPLVFANDSEPVVEIREKVESPGRYNFVIHYKQPDHPSFDADVMIQGDQIFDATTRLDYCPSLAGCRAVILQRDSNSSTFYISDNFQLTVKSPTGKSVLLDYILIVPVDAIDDNTMVLEPHVNSFDFIRECGQDAFYMDSNSTSAHCKKAVFSLTADYNGVTFPCKCSVLGSKGQECDQFGGQCHCKANVIGRKCERCRTGFFGFPDCKPCNCPSTAYCDERTGKCVCPPKVTGEQCDRCMVHTYGFDKFQGCEECKCHSKGVVKLSSGKADLQCNLTTGQCPCRENIVGRMCEQCLRGYAYFPHCQFCNCDVRGVTEQFCDPYSAKCFCKENVRGESCEVCTPDSFNIEESNPDGCTKCFCFGTTDRCKPSQHSRIQVSDMASGYQVFSIASSGNVLDFQKLEPELDYKIEYLDDEISVTLLREVSYDGNRNYYVSLPAAYLGKKIASYGGNLSYSVMNVQKTSARVGTALTFDVILVGSSFVIGYVQDDQPEDPNAAFAYSVEILERNFKHPSRNDVTREQLMMLLIHLEQVYVRLSYFKQSTGFNMYHLMMDTATSEKVADVPAVPRVEQCICPINYKGTSCEECNDGFFRLPTGPYLGFCVPCQCNGHADKCDVVTGKCGTIAPPGEIKVREGETPLTSYCKDNTHGEYCEHCNPGYYGNATNGQPFDCTICSCPLPEISNNFATSCDVFDDGSPISCKCKPEYRGSRCESCAAGFYGKPLELGDHCKPCQCNGNIIASDPASCDPVTGLCLACLNNTAGPSCEICASGYFGDAVVRKDCQKCACDPCGTDHCDDKTGQCICKPNVMGELCDQCAKDHYGIERQGTCNGCIPCQCANASLTTSCDSESGQCQCQPGAGGRTCDTCEPGFWRYSSDGCTSCNCGARFSQGAVCDQQSGQCQCLPGVVGKNCESCPWRWVFIEKIGCKECDLCQHFLLDDTDGMRNATTAIRKELQEASLSVLSRRKAMYLGSKVDEFQDVIKQFGEPNADLSPVAAIVKEAESNITDHSHNSSMMLKTAAKIAEETHALRLLALNTTDVVKGTIIKSIQLIAEVKSLEESFANPSVLQNIDHTLIRGQQLLDEQKVVDFSNETARNRDELESAENLIERSREFPIPAKTNSKLINETFQRLEVLNRKIRDLFNQSAQANSAVVSAEQLNIIATDTQEKINQDKSEAARLVSASNVTTADVKLKLNECKPHLIQFQSHSVDMAIGTRNLVDKKDKLRVDLKELKMNPPDLRPLVHQATDESFKMIGQANDLIKLFNSTKMGAIDAMSASEAYRSIANNLTEAEKGVREAEVFAKSLDQQKIATRENVNLSKEASDRLKREAADLSLNFSSRFEQPVSEAVDKVKNISENLTKLKDFYDSIVAGLSILPNKELETTSRTAVTFANTALQDVEVVTTKIAAMDTRISEGAKEAEKIPIAYREINNDIKNGNSYTSRVSETVPETGNLMTRVEGRIPSITNQQKVLDGKLEEIRKAIKQARSLANRIELGVAFSENTTLQLRNPENLLTSGTYTKFALSFKTEEYNALLAYIGNPLSVVQSTRKKRAVNESSALWLSPTEQASPVPLSDFLALEIRNSRVVLTIDLGSGPERTENGMFVSNNVWHDVVVERIGKQVTLLVSANDSKQERADSLLVGAHNVFNVDPSRSKILIGGIPPAVTIQKDVANLKLKSGSIANVAFGDTPLGLWNFVEGAGSKNGSEQKQITTDVSSAGMRFDGSSYVILARDKFDFTLETYVQLSFKTFARDGLLFLIGNEKDFLSIYMTEGKVLVTYDLGSGFVHLQSKEGMTLNDGQWHNVDLNRKEREALLRIDGQEAETREAIGKSTTLETNDKIYVGGYPGSHSYPIPKINFEGCIQDLQIGNLKLDLNKNLESSPNVIKGCPAVISREASFRAEAQGFIEMPLTSDISDYAVLTIKYRTVERAGLLFFASNPDFTSFFALFINERGQLVLRTEPGGETVMTRKRFIGDSWHYVTATKDQSKLLIEIDDEFDENAEIKTSTPLSIPSNNTLMYFGGVPKDQQYILVGKSIPTHFIGCFGDVVLNSQFQNFATSSNRPGASLASCPLHETASNVPPDTKDKVTAVTPLPEVTETTTSVTLDGCSIPLNPQVDISVTPAHGLRFGKAHDTRLEFQMSTSLQSSFLDSTRFEIELKTTATEGVILYVGSKQVDFAGLYMNEGRLHFSWNLGGRMAHIRREELINDGKWHKVAFLRERREGRLKVDDETELTNTSIGEEISLNVKTPIFVGGLSDEVSKQTKNNMKGVTNSFPGCLRSLKIQGELQDFAKDSISYGTRGCSDKVEPGVFFHSNGGHVILKDKFRVGDRIKIDMKIKPRTRSGVLLSVTGKSDFLILQMVNGELKFSVDNGGGVMSVVQKPAVPLCDGDWHTVQAVKEKNIITLSSDNNNMGIQVGTGGISSTDTNDPLYVGGVPAGESTRGLETKDQFVGCITDLRISDRIQPFSSAIVIGDVTLSACPTT